MAPVLQLNEMQVCLWLWRMLNGMAVVLQLNEMKVCLWCMRIKIAATLQLNETQVYILQWRMCNWVAPALQLNETQVIVMIDSLMRRGLRWGRIQRLGISCHCYLISFEKFE